MYAVPPPRPSPAANGVRKPAAPPEPIRLGRLFFHSAAAAYMLAAYLSLGKAMAKLTPAKEEYGGELRFLTILAMIVTLLTMVFAALHDLMPNDQVVYVLKRVFGLVALPIDIVVSAIYWPIIMTAPELMLPPRPDGSGALLWIPLWIDLGLHLVPAVTLIIDFFALDSKYHPPISTRGALVMAMIIGVAYGFWTEYAAYHNDGMFPYPFLTQMAEDERIWVYLGGSALAVVVFWILNALHK